MPADAAVIVKREQQLLLIRQAWDAEYRDLTKYILPRKQNTFTGNLPGSKQTTGVFDGTAIKANEDLAATMQGTLTSPSLRWFSLRMRQKELNDLLEVREWLDESADRMYLALQQSNFEAEMYEGYLDLGAFGIGALFLEESDTEGAGFGGFRFRHYTVGEYVIGEDAKGRVNTFFHRLTISGSAALVRFGDGLSERVREKITQNPDADLTFLHAIFPREGGSNALGTPVDQLPWASVYIERSDRVSATSAPSGAPRVVEEAGYHEFPVMVPRWSRSGNEIYGRGPGHVALPDIKSINKAMDFTFAEWALAIRPPQKALHGGIAGSIRMVPAAINWVYQMDAIDPLDTGAQFQTNILSLDRLEQKIRAAFFAELLDLPPLQGTPASATEIARRFEIMERKLGPTIGRQKSEMLGPLIDRKFGLMERAGVLPDPPAAIIEAAQRGNRRIDVEYEGPLERAQRATDLVAIERKNVWVATIVELRPEVLDNFDWDEEARHVATIAGLPARLMRRQDEVQRIREIRAKEAVKAAEMAQAQQVADITARGGRGLKALSEAAGNGQAGTP